jgi:tripartite-type tricarboxylate transporter receptor subunit TctC
MFTFRRLKCASIALLAALAASAAVGQTYPDRPVRIVVPFPSGGFSDILARQLGKSLTDRLGQQFIVDNRTGAGGNIGAEAAARSAPDGYTLFLSTIATHGINPSLYAKLPFDPIKDFAPVILLVATPNVFVVNRNDVKSVEQLRALARTKPRGLNVASAGVGTSGHLSAELFRGSTGIEMAHVPYKGSAPALTDLMGGQVDLMFDNLMFQMPHIKGGKVFAVGVMSKQRSPVLPDVPTMSELGVQGMDYGPWFAISAPAGTPRPIVAKLNEEMNQILATADFRKAMTGADVLGGTPEAFDAFQRAEIARWKAVAERAHIEKQ